MEKLIKFNTVTTPPGHEPTPDDWRHPAESSMSTKGSKTSLEVMSAPQSTKQMNSQCAHGGTSQMVVEKKRHSLPTSKHHPNGEMWFTAGHDLPQGTHSSASSRGGWTRVQKHPTGSHQSESLLAAAAGQRPKAPKYFHCREKKTPPLWVTQSETRP